MTDETSLHVANAIRGDHDSVGWLITHFRGLVEAQVRLRLRGLGSAPDIEDVAADVWVVVLQRLGDLVPREGRPTPVLVRFLGTTVLGTCNNFLRRRARRVLRQAPADPDDDANLDAQAQQTKSLVSRILVRESASVVDACLAELSPDHRDVLVLRLMEGRSNQEIGELLAVPANTIAVRYRRALESLRQHLPPSLFEGLGAVPE